MNYCGKCGTKLKQNAIICEICGNLFDINNVYDLEFLNNFSEKIKKKKQVITIIVITIAFLINIFSLIYLIESFPLLFIVSICSCIFIINRFIYHDITQYDLLYKKIIVYDIMKKKYKDVTYKPMEGFSKERIDALNMLQTGSIYKSSDYVRGIYKNISFECADLLIQDEHTDSDGNRYI